MNTKILQNLGLTTREAEIYLILLDTGSTTTGQIIKKSGLHKATIYSILQRLVDRGLVSYIVKERARYFEATDPENLLDFLKEKEDSLKEILPELKKKKEQSKQKQEAYILEGLKGLKTVRDRSLKVLSKGDELLVLGASKASNMALESYWTNYHNKRVREGINARMLWNETAKRWGKEREKLPLTQLKYLPKELETPANIDIYKNVVDISVFAEKPFIFHIENKTLADAFRNYFNLLWNQDVKMYKGFEAVTEKFWSMLDLLKSGEEYFVLGASHGFGGKKLKEWFMTYHTERVKRKIKANLLSVYEDYNSIHHQLTDTGDPQMKYGEIERLAPEFSSPMQINLYRPNRVLMFLWGKEFLCFEIESDVLYKNFKSYFDGLWNQDIKTVRGLDDVKELFLETLDCGELRMIGARGYLLERVKGFYDYYKERALKSGVRWKNIVDIGTKGKPITTLPFVETRYVGKEFVTPVAIWLYNNKVVSVNWEGKIPIAFVIEDEMLYKNYMEQFDLLWNQETQTLRGFDAVWEHLQDLASSGEEVYFIGARGYYFDRYPENLKIFEDLMIKNRTTIKNIVDFGAKGKSFLKIKNQEIKYVSNEFLNPNAVWIYKNKVAITQYIEGEKDPILLLINNKQVYQAHKKQFELLWKTAFCRRSRISNKKDNIV